MDIEEIFGGWKRSCDNCEEEDYPLLHWEKPRKFDLCLDCLSKLYLKYVAEIEKENEKLIVNRKVISEELRSKIFERDDWKCVYCENKITLEIDHKIPFSKGGTTNLDNLQTICKKCNSKKRAKIDY